MVRFRRDPFAELCGEVNRVQKEFERLFQTPTNGSPSANLWQDEQAFHAELDLPGVDPAGLEVTVTEGTTLLVKGERPAPSVDGAAWLRQERPAGTFTRRFELPSLVDADKVEARYEHGVLRLTLPKSEAAKPRKITVQG